MNNMKMPASYAVLNAEEMTCTEGGGILAQVCYAFGTMFSGVYYDSYQNTIETNVKNHGSVVVQNGNTYTFSDGTTVTIDQGYSWGFSSLGNFFNGLGRLFSAFGI